MKVGLIGAGGILSFVGFIAIRAQGAPHGLLVIGVFALFVGAIIVIGAGLSRDD